MNNKVKIRISENAYDRLIYILKDNTEYSHLRFSFKDGCCNSSKIELYLDNVRAGDIEETIEKLPIIYNSLVIGNIKDITVVYRNGSFMVKTELLNGLKSNCSTCTSGCGGNANASEGCLNCKKDGYH